ncbi:unnamed protein product, partial [Brugia pahangi]|uniref:Transcriptional regulator n=1 Tax=Brugia pahangi TaxID=6280 RepID=A0A0N4TFZ1_BRUPA
MRRLRDDLNSRLDDGKSEDEAAMVSGAVMVMKCQSEKYVRKAGQQKK